MNQHDWLAEQFEQNRSHLQAEAYRMLGSAGDADDAVQEAWLRLRRSDASRVANLKAWLTTVVARLCLDMLRSRKSRREEAIDSQAPRASMPDASDLMFAAALGDRLVKQSTPLRRCSLSWLPE